MATRHLRNRLAGLGAAGAIAASLFVAAPAAHAATAAPAAPVAPAAATARIHPADVGSICYKQLPSQAHDTLDLIAKGGPYPYPEDGTVFSNREGVLPQQQSGYYHEFTVVTPGAPTRGTRRIVTGEQKQEDYYTSDHYETFDLVDFTC